MSASSLGLQSTVQTGDFGAIVQLCVTVGLFCLIALIVAKGLPKLILRAISSLGAWTVGDLSALNKPAVIGGSLFFQGWLVAGASISIANSLGVDTAGITQWLMEFGGQAGRWIAKEAVQIGVVVLAAAVIVQGARRVVPPLIRGVVRNRARSDTLNEELEKREATLVGVVTGVVKWTVYIVALILILSEIGINITPIIATAGVVGIAVGFGAQNLIKDIFSGLFILMEDQYRVGDWVDICGSSGLVEDVNLRRTVLRDLEFAVHVIPNGQIGVVKNLTKDKSRMVVDVGVAYKEDVDRVIGVINQVGEEMQADSQWGPKITEKVQVLRVNDLADSSVNIRVIGQTLPIWQWDVAGEFRRRIKRRFDQEGIEIPFPHQTIYWGIDQPPVTGGYGTTTTESKK